MHVTIFPGYDLAHPPLLPFSLPQVPFPSRIQIPEHSPNGNSEGQATHGPWYITQ